VLNAASNEHLSGVVSGIVASTASGTIFIHLIALPSTHPVVIAFDAATGGCDWTKVGPACLDGVLRIDGGTCFQEQGPQLVLCGSTRANGSRSHVIFLDPADGSLKDRAVFPFQVGIDSLCISERYGRIIAYDVTSQRIVALPTSSEAGDPRYAWSLKATFAAADETAVGE